MSDFIPPEHRDQLGTWLNEHGLTGLGVEVGAARGDFSRIILSAWEGRRLYLIDPWEKQDATIYRERTNHEAPFAEWFEQCKELFHQDSRAGLFPGLSLNAVSAFHSRQLDFVYLDGNHSYEAVTADLNAWWPKLMDGGLLGGHDYLNKLDEGWHCEVKRAVDDWCAQRHLTSSVSACTSWWIQKQACHSDDCG